MNTFPFREGWGYNQIFPLDTACLSGLAWRGGQQGQLQVWGGEEAGDRNLCLFTVRDAQPSVCQVS